MPKHLQKLFDVQLIYFAIDKRDMNYVKGFAQEMENNQGLFTVQSINNCLFIVCYSVIHELK